MKRFLCLIGFVALVAGCDTIPREALNAYVSAFDEARAAGELLTADFAAAQAETTRREAARRPAAPAALGFEIPIVYVPPASDPPPPTATEVRLLAWQVIGQYNAVLAALSAGESVGKLREATGGLGTTIGRIAEATGSAVPGIGALVSAAQELAAILEKARLSEEFAKAIAEGAPKVRSMLSVMIGDVSSHHQLRAALANFDIATVDRNNALDANTKKLQRARIKDAFAELKTTMDQFVILARKCDAALAKIQAAPRTPIDFTAQANEILTLSIALKGHWQAYQAARIEGAK